MKRHEPCDGCGQQTLAASLRHVLRLQARGALWLCPRCWADCKDAVYCGAWELPALLEELADHRSLCA